MDPDIAYANADFIPGADRYPARWARKAAAFRAVLVANGQARLALPYGPGARQRYDLFTPATAPRGLVLFVHGGYWRAFDRSDWSHLAGGLLANGWAVAMPSYSLAPTVRIPAITGEIATALAAAAREVTGPIRLAGHSAGGHLVARMNCADVALPAAVAGRLTRILAISPLGDLRPLTHTEINTDLRLDANLAVAESPALCPSRRAIATTVWVGAEERPAFLDQARGLADAWPEARLHVAPGRHHFDVIDGLADPDGPLTRALLA